VLSTIRRKVNTGERIDQEEALFLLTEAELLDLAPMAQQLRYRHNEERRVTFVVDTNLNYTNVCDAYCTFCAFYRADPEHEDAYTSRWRR
jgi:cyclic dehypoxanthinyl futalosine synthase